MKVPLITDYFGDPFLKKYAQYTDYERTNTEEIRDSILSPFTVHIWSERSVGDLNSSLTVS